MAGLSGQRVAITGATGLVGTALGAALRARGHEVLAISRNPGPGGIRWNPSHGEIDLATLEGVDAIVHLAGENLAGSRWTAERKRLLRDSRVAITSWLAESLALLDRKPAVLIAASAIGIYGNRRDEMLDESSAPGDDFLAELVVNWEAAADAAVQEGIRVVQPRFGIILSPDGGALARMVPPFRLGLGGPMGNGRQWMSWIAIDDIVGGIEHAIATGSLNGPVNFTSPDPVRNADFAHALGAVLHRPAVIPLPAFALRLAFGEMADVALLASQRVLPTKLLASGYVIRHTKIEAALETILSP